MQRFNLFLNGHKVSGVANINIFNGHLLWTFGDGVPLQARVQEAAEKAKEMGFEQNTKGPAVFMAGHSFGGTCASTLTSAYRRLLWP